MIPLKHVAFRRVSAVTVTAVMLFITVFSLSTFAKAATFSPRLSAPAKSNKYYYSDLNVYYRSGWGMPNCTAYAFGRAYEILGKEPNLSWYSAQYWYDHNRSGGYYKYGMTPKVGAIACWSYNGGGHVAVVEKIDSDGTMTLSNSGWNYLEFYLTKANKNDSNPGGNSWWTFQGYIYIIDSADVVEPTAEYKTGVYKVQVDSTLNMRSGAGTNNSYVASVPNNAKLNVTKVQNAGGYTWGYTTYNGKTGWVALDYCTYVSELPQETTAKPTQPTTVKPTVAPTTAKPTVAPTTVKPTEPEPTLPIPRGQIEPEPEPTTVAPTTVQPTTAAPTTVQPTTAAPTTVQPTTVAPTTVQPTTAPSRKSSANIGDVNEDGSLSVTDATLIQKYLSNVLKLDADKVRLCDFNYDGQVTIDDVTCMQRYLSQTHSIMYR